ncbi:tripartite tricarboxylate transporter substrate binding protein [Ottowia sp. GY511]|nr:tripartite tricarboxylate transporter substrate binding protein [Ottowia sp. GY511]TXK30982.1 tripartite tricarboxylate transporter substrate binding protein [Ottowia sp. GY511]
MPMNRRQLLRCGAAFGATLAAGTPAWAEGKPIQIIVPFGPGGSGDISARMLGEWLTKKTGRPVTVDNRPGANGIIGVEAARKGPADGTVLLLATTSTHLANPSLFKKLPYDPGKDFRLVGSFGQGSFYLLVNPSSLYKTVAEFVQAAKAEPGKLNYGYFNATSSVSSAMFAATAGITMTGVPYKQVGQAMTELMAGQLQVVFTDTVQGDAFVASGQLRALAVHSGERLKRFPQVPLVRETYPDFDVSAGFLGVAVPAGTPVAIQQQLNDLINEAVTTDPIKSRLEGFGFTPHKVSLAELANFERTERAKWPKYVAIAKLEVQ